MSDLPTHIQLYKHRVLYQTEQYPFVFLLVNGYLIGREYFEFVAVRRLEPPAARALRIRYKKRIWGYGIVVSILMIIPLINWLMPVIAAAYMVHNFEHVRAGADDQ